MPTLAANGIDLAYDIHGEGDTTVVLVCGTGQPAAMWAMTGTLDALLGAGYRVVTFDNRGIPPSACPSPPWTVADMVGDAIAVIEATAPGPVHLLGASLGANIAHAVALARPDLVRSVTMMVGGVQFAPGFIPIISGMQELRVRGVDPPKELGLFLMIEAMLPPLARLDADAVAMVESMAPMLTETFGPGGEQGQQAANLDWISGGTARTDELADLTLPALFIANELDPIFSVDEIQRGAALAPDARVVVVPGVSHVAFDPESSAIATTAMMDFLATH
jgi:pimeloyl-ACP methyl ester carboxylesterase